MSIGMSDRMFLYGVEDLLSRRSSVESDAGGKSQSGMDAGESLHRIRRKNTLFTAPDMFPKESQNGDTDDKSRSGYDKMRMTKKEKRMFGMTSSAEKALNEQYSKKLEFLGKAWNAIEEEKSDLEEKCKVGGKWKSNEDKEYYDKLVTKKVEIENYVAKLEEKKDSRREAYISAAKVEHALDRAGKLTNRQFVYNLAVATSQAVN